MRNLDGASTYIQSKLLSSSREQVVPLLYGQLLLNLRRAAQQIESHDLEGKATSMDRASTILFELVAALDPEAGGELASRLGALYAYFLREVASVSRSLDRARLDRLIRMIDQLRDAWEQAAQEVVSVGAAGA